MLLLGRRYKQLAVVHIHRSLSLSSHIKKCAFFY
jgi:hypothetical protein